MVRPLGGLAVGLLVLLCGALGYHYLSTNGLESRVGRHDVELQELSQTAAVHERRIGSNDTLLEEHERKIRELGESLDAVRTRLAEAEKALQEAVARGQATEEELKALSERVSQLQKDQQLLAQDYGQRKQEIQRLKEQLADQERINLEVDRRLRALEGAEGGPPAP